MPVRARPGKCHLGPPTVIDAGSHNGRAFFFCLREEARDSGSNGCVDSLREPTMKLFLTYLFFRVPHSYHKSGRLRMFVVFALVFRSAGLMTWLSPRKTTFLLLKAADVLSFSEVYSDYIKKILRSIVAHTHSQGMYLGFPLVAYDIFITGFWQRRQLRPSVFCHDSST